MQDNTPTIIPYLTVHPDRITFHNDIVWPAGKSSKKDCHSLDFGDGICGFIKNFKNNNNKGRISKPAKRKIEKAINYLSIISTKQKVFVKEIGKSIDFKLTFVTLTLPSRQIHSDQQIRRDCMHHFLTTACRKWNINRYVCRSERQENGNLHFHFVCQNFIPHQELRDVWNNIINKLGYVDEYRQSMKAYHKAGCTIRKDLIKYWPIPAQKKAYKTGIANDWSSPNTTDIHSLRFINNIPNYICKYMSKGRKTYKGKSLLIIEKHDANYFLKVILTLVGSGLAVLTYLIFAAVQILLILLFHKSCRRFKVQIKLDFTRKNIVKFYFAISNFVKSCIALKF
jgi:hypothetical protein